MYIREEKKILISLLAIIIVLGSFELLFVEQNAVCTEAQRADSTSLNLTPSENLSPISFSSVQIGPMNAFPGQLINESYYLGTTDPSPSYYEVTVTLNNSSYETLDAFPTDTSGLTPSGYYLLFSFEMPNDQPGMWWTLGYQILPVTISTIQGVEQTVLTAGGTQILMQYSTESMAGSYMIKGIANFSFASNFTEVQLYPSNPQGTIIVSSQVNYWNFVSGVIKVDFSLYENIGNSNGLTTPPLMFASVDYNFPLSITTSGIPISEAEYRITLIQGNGAYIMGITSGQIAEITNAMNQTLSIPISQLNAAVVSINGDVATLQTSFGTMLTDLSSINASISTIRSGVAYLNTSIGQVKTSLSSINATIVTIKDDTVTLETSLGTIYTNLNAVNATVSSIKNDQATITTAIGNIQVSLSSINAIILSIENGQASLITDVGLIETSLFNLNATIFSVSSGEAKIVTDIGDINTSIRSLNASFDGMSGTAAVIQTDIGIIETSLNSINATIFSVHLGIVGLNTSIGKVEVSLKSLNASIIGLSGDTAKIMTIAGEVNASLSDLNTTILVSGSGTSWFNDTYATIETCLGNITGTVTNVSNDTATIETNLGVVTASVNSIKTMNGQGLSGDSFSLFDLIVITLLGTLIIIASLAMLSSRSTLKIMGDRVK